MAGTLAGVPTRVTDEVRGGGSCTGGDQRESGPSSQIGSGQAAHWPLYRVRIPHRAAIAFPTHSVLNQAHRPEWKSDSFFRRYASASLKENMGF